MRTSEVLPVGGTRSSGRRSCAGYATRVPTEPRRLPIPRLIILLALLAAWGSWFIYRSSFEIEGQRYFCLFDDPMISMTYARNLVEGHGLNWARHGEPVEGFTHPLWTFLMVPVNALPLPLRDRSLLVQILSLVLMGATVVAVRRLVLDHFSAERARHWLPAAVLTAFYYPFLYWSLMGMETALQALLAVLAVHLSLSIVHLGSDRHLSLWLLCAAAFLLRMDMLHLVAAVQGYVLLRGGLRPAARRSWIAGLAVFLGVALAYGVFRWVYFHDLLPNTYYLKLYGVPLTVRVLRGLDLLAAFVRAHLALLVAVGVGTAVALRRNPRLALPAAVFLLYCAYSVYVGGDVWEKAFNGRANRFVVFAMPLVFVLLNALLNQALSAWRLRWGETPDSLAGRVAVAGVTAVSLLLVNGLWLSDRAEESWRDLVVTQRPPYVDNHMRQVAQLVRFQRIVKPGAVVATAWAGIPAYFSDYRMIDILGYNDAVLARRPPNTPLDEDSLYRYMPGHNKFDQDRLLREQRPDAFFQLWSVRRGMTRITEVLPRFGYRRVSGIWVREDSVYVRRGGLAAQAPGGVPR